MSYILDALRKAEAQRDRQRVPGLHDQTGAPPTPAVLVPGLLLWGVVALAVASLALAVWQLWPGTGHDLPYPVAQGPAPVVVEPLPAPESAPLPAGEVRPPAPAVQPAPPPPAPAVQETAPARRAPPAAAAPPSAPQAATPQARPQPVTPPQAAPPQAAPPQAAPPPAASSVPPLGDPPADAPRIAINGGVYSADAAQRMLLVNGQVFNEGAEVAPGLVLEQIRPNQAVLRWRGQRYALRY